MLNSTQKCSNEKFLKQILTCHLKTTKVKFSSNKVKRGQILFFIQGKQILRKIKIFVLLFHEKLVLMS